MEALGLLCRAETALQNHPPGPPLGSGAMQPASALCPAPPMMRAKQWAWPLLPCMTCMAQGRVAAVQALLARGGDVAKPCSWDTPFCGVGHACAGCKSWTRSAQGSLAVVVLRRVGVLGFLLCTPGAIIKSGPFGLR